MVAERTRKWAAFVVPVALLAACASGDDGSPGDPATSAVAPETAAGDVADTSASAGDIAADIAADTGTTTVEAVPSSTTLQEDDPPGLDLADEPFIFFGPVSESPPGSDLPLPEGSSDYFELFDDDAPWQRALAELDAFKIHFWQARHYLSDDDLVRMGDFLRRHDIPLIVEAEPLDPPDPAECDHTESFEGPYELEQAQRLRDLGVDIAAVAIEQPFSFAYKFGGPGACRYDLDRILDEVVSWVADLREIHPDVLVGSIEGVWAQPETTPDDFALWLDSYAAAAGEPFAFQHIDINWGRADWVETALAIEDVVESRGVPFGIIYNGGSQGTTSDEWLELAAERFAEYERAGGTPDHVGFQSWHDFPDRVLPDDDTSAFTNLIVRYLGDRARFDAGPSVDPVDGAITGRLVDDAGAPLAGRTVSADVLAAGRSRLELTATDVVPAGASEALVAVRVNSDDAVRGPSDAEIHSIRLRSSDPTVGSVPNEEFLAGTESWGIYDDNTGQASVVDTASGPALRLRAVSADEVINIDGGRFAVAPGADIEMTLDVDLAGSLPAGDVVLISFDSEGEIGRTTVPLQVPSGRVGDAVTDDDGVFVIDTGSLAPGEYQVEISTASDASTWPTSQLGAVTVG